MSRMKIALSLAAALGALGVATGANAANADTGRYMRQCEAVCTTALFQQSCLQQCTAEKSPTRQKRGIILVRVPKDPPAVPFIAFDGGGGGIGGGGGGRGK